MDISYDPAKRAKVLAERGIDFARAGAVFDGKTAEVEDTRRDYGERRFVTAARSMSGLWWWFGRLGMARGASYR